LVFTKVLAHLPNTVEPTKLKIENSMTIEIQRRDVAGNADPRSWEPTVVALWWPSGDLVNAARKSWKQFADLLSSEAVTNGPYRFSTEDLQMRHFDFFQDSHPALSAHRIPAALSNS